MYLTAKQKETYQFIKIFIDKNGRPPSYEEIREALGVQSLNAVAKQLKQLERKGCLQSPWGNRKRALELIPLKSNAVRIPLFGRVAAGKPIEPVEVADEIDVPEWLLTGKETFALTVEGQSMIDEGIREDDVLIVRKQDYAETGQTVVALVDGEATVKRFFRNDATVTLRPANEHFVPLVVDAERVSIVGVVVGLYRKYTP
ncbi:MAG TPA: transcriptional repressor LexA [Thermodesulfobacteriota bacterium]|nr:transcriptional repressor LexA [Deltaproteobacteria bacterium]HNR13257.1 transcriptional repressor LexA [Thermodesulfobacteriota bacterium]HOC38867.1 transcriptional repressor LexA [Thermodesulfobacteriota bacterium]HQO77443.1 transcriptional repressor LexA [Thermodesulfobacteriota bacterium]